MIADLIIMAGLAALSALLVMLMIRIGRLDRPGPRSSHEVATPKGGGVGIAAAFAFGTVIFALLHGASAQQSAMLSALVIAAAGLAAIAFLDDLFDWSFSIKLGAQVVAAIVVVAMGFRVASASSWYGDMFAIAAIGWIVFVTNAVNFIDGLNGLASGVALITSMFVATSFYPAGTLLFVAPTLALAAGIAGFLPFNYPGARIFMGDVGSQLCGFILATLGVLAVSRRGAPGEPFLIPFVLSGILFDVGVTLIRRARRGAVLTEAHRDHLYQLAQRSGMQAWVVTMIHWAMAIWGGACALSLWSDVSRLAVFQAAIAVAVPQCLWLSYVAARSRKAALPF